MSNARMNRLILWLLAAVLAGCAASVTKIETGEVTVSERLRLRVDQPWNQFPNGALGERVPTWTREGFSVDALQFYIGLKDGQEIGAPAPKGKNPLIVRGDMKPQQVAGLFEALWTRDGSSFELTRIQPTPVMGGDGFRFEYNLNRKADDVRMRGVAFGLVRDGQLTLIHYRAPRLVFFPRYLPQVEALVATARLQ